MITDPNKIFSFLPAQIMVQDLSSIFILSDQIIGSESPHCLAMHVKLGIGKCVNLIFSSELFACLAYKHWHVSSQREYGDRANTSRYTLSVSTCAPRKHEHFRQVYKPLTGSQPHLLTNRNIMQLESVWRSRTVKVCPLFSY